jgi:polyhydroxybutyrate depolymerase
MTLTRRFAGACFALLLVMVSAALAGCSGPAAGHAKEPAIAPGTTGTVKLENRPFTLAVPSGYDAGDPVPLVVSLHGYSEHGQSTADYLGLTSQFDSEGFLLAYPDGLKDSSGNRFWDATDACCDFDGSGVDDSAYVSKLILTVEDQYAVDTKRVVVIGHSNGGFMALRIACDHADQIAAAVSVAGEMPVDTSSCKPSKKVSMLQIQGDADEIINYKGGGILGTGTPYPGAEQTVKDWRTLDDCGDTATKADPVDYEKTLEGPETDRTSWSCADGTEVGLWTIHGAVHGPTWSAQFAPDLADWLLAHGR